MISGSTGGHMPPRQKRRAQAKYPSYFHKKSLNLILSTFPFLLFSFFAILDRSTYFVDLGADVGAQGHKGREHLGQLEDGQPRPH